MSEAGTLRTARTDADDERFLWLMLVEAASWRPGLARLSVAAAARDRSHARYVEGWGRAGDLGLIAELAGSPIGAAWWRFFTDENHGYGFIEAAIPELSLAVTKGRRGCGVGGALLAALIERARQAELPALSLSVEVDNPALRLYERLGFTAVARVGNAWTMRIDTRGG
ncbi:MAG TPA: GNAT family N-acetyltransferase [Solirubrobacteraceae bacterium]|nr:GNAT family N-acetyltransferase [Solirubrobacteraceae bacterium]